MRYVTPALIALFVCGGGPSSAQTPARADADPRIQRLIAAVSEQRLREIDAMLASFGTRETLSTTASKTRGIGAARQWIFDELKRASPRLQVGFDTYHVAKQGRVTRDSDVVNVIAILPGRTSRRVYITGHYDSLNVGNRGALNGRPPGSPDPQESPAFDHDADAPGANDDGSGTALTMELARVFAESGIDFDATLVFACWAGEEQGLIGSGAHAQRIAKQKVVVDAMLSNDIVGNVKGGNGLVDSASVRVYSQGPEDSMSRSLARYIAGTAAAYVPSHRVRLMAREDRFGRASDQASFTAFAYPAVVFRESREDFSRQHSKDDTLDGVDFAYLAQNARVNAAAAMSLALAPPAPTVTDDRNRALLTRTPSGYDAHLQWKASPGATAYRVYWRDAWANDWDHSQAVGNVTELVMPNVSIDDYVFGVAAVGADGHESLISAYVATPRKIDHVKLAK